MDKLRKKNEIRKKLKNKKPSIGSWLQFNNSDIAELIGSSGYDWVAIDMEHGSISYQDLTNLSRAS